MVGEARRHGRCTGPPHLGGPAAIGGFGNPQRLAHARMRQDAVVRALEQHELMRHAVGTLAQRVDSTAHCRHALANVPVQPRDESAVALPATGRKHVLNPLPGAEHDPMFPPHEASTPGRLHHLCLAQLWQRPPTRLRPRPLGSAALRLAPIAEMRQQCRAVLLEAIRQKQGHPAWR